MSDSSSPVLTEIRGHVLIVTINRPQVINSFNFEVSRSVELAMDLLERRDDLFVGIITGAGGNFSSGSDLKEAAVYGPPPEFRRGYYGVMRRPPSKPIIAAVEGYAIGGGLELCLACDLIVASREATFGLPEVKHGFLATAGGLFRLPRQLPYHVAMELALTGGFKKAPCLERFGMVNRLTEPGEALNEAIELAEVLSENGPVALSASKEIIFQSRNWHDDESWEKQKPLAQKMFDSEDRLEGMKAFAEKRKPVWRGR